MSQAIEERTTELQDWIAIERKLNELEDSFWVSVIKGALVWKFHLPPKKRAQFHIWVPFWEQQDW